MEYYVYAYLDPRKSGNFKYGDYEFDYEPFYIGKGKRNRINQHLCEYSLNSSGNNFKNNLIKKLLKLGLEPITLKLKENLSDEESLKLEIFYIKTIGRRVDKNGPLTNLTLGGESNLGWIPTEETKKLWSEQRKGKKQTPAQYAANCKRIITEIQRKRCSIQFKGKKQSRELIEKRIAKLRGRIPSEETKKLWSEQRKGKKQTPAQYAANLAKINRINWISYQEFKQFYQNNKIKSPQQWKAFIKENIIPKNIPRNPDTVYKKRNTWISWKDLSNYDINPPVLSDKLNVLSI